MAMNSFKPFPSHFDSIDNLAVQKIIKQLEDAKLDSNSAATSAWDFLLKLGNKDVQIIDSSASSLLKIVLPAANLLQANIRTKEFETFSALGKALSNIIGNFIDKGYGHLNDCFDILTFLDGLISKLENRKHGEHLQKIYQIRLSTKIYQLQIFKNGDIFSRDLGFIPLLVKFHEIDSQRAKYFLYQFSTLWQGIFSKLLIDADVNFWNSVCDNSDSVVIREAICDLLVKLIHLYPPEHCLLIISKLCSAFDVISDDLVLTALSRRPLEECLQLLSKKYFKLGMLLCKTNRLLSGEEQTIVIELTNTQCFSFINLVLKRIHQEINNLSVSSRNALLCNVAQLLKISTLPTELWTKYAIFFCHAACQIDAFDVCKNISFQILENEQAKKSDSFHKLLHLLGGTLFKKHLFSPAAWYLQQLINLTDTSDPSGYVSKLELLSSAYFKNGQVLESAHALKTALEVCTRLYWNVEKFKLLASRWCSLFDNCENLVMPILEKPDAFQIIFDYASVKLRDQIFENVASDDPQVCYLRHCHWMWKWKSGDVLLYHRDSIELQKKFSESEYWLLIFQLMEQIWNFSLRRTIDISFFICWPKVVDDRCQFLVDVLYTILNLTDENQAKKLDSFVKASLYQLSNLSKHRECVEPVFNKHNFRIDSVKESILKVHDILSNKKKMAVNAAFLPKDVRLSLDIMEEIEKLGNLYEMLGVWKPCRHYYEQAAQTAAALCPKSSRHNRLMAKLESLDASIKEHVIFNDKSSMASCPYFYSVSPVDDVVDKHVDNLLHTFINSSPFYFRRHVLNLIYAKALPLKLAVNLLNMSSWLFYERRAQYDDIENLKGDDYDDLVFAEQQDFYKFIDSFSIIESSPLLNFTFDDELQNLIIFIKHHDALLIVPLGPKKFNFKACSTFIEDILSQNKESLFGMSNLQLGLDCNEPEFKRAWWKKRQNLDAQLKSLACQIDSEWLALFGKFFVETTNDDISDYSKNRFLSGLNKFIEDLYPNCMTSSQLTLTNPLVSFLLSHGPSPRAKTLDSLLDIIQETLGMHSCDRPKALRALRKCYEETFEDVESENLFLVSNRESLQFNSIVLILDKYLHTIPWEITPTFKSVQIYRLPSIWHLMNRPKRKDTLNIKYILNPSGDLKRTEQAFAERLSRWEGIVGRPPKEEEFLSMINSGDLFIYFGHGGGDAYVTANGIRKLKDSNKCSSSFLIGCSSGKIRQLGSFCPEGTFLNYLHAGCPIVLVNLWDVTDKDIDQFTESLFDKIGLWDENCNDKNRNLAEAVNSSRNVCFLRHLNGAAPVVYGLPLDF